jgi:SOS-response transcriptional repressor LexA
VDGIPTIKYLAKDDGGYFLKPANKSQSDIRPKESLKMFGVVTGSYRKY